MRREDLRHVSRHYAVRHFARKAEWEAYAVWLRRNSRVGLGLLPEPPESPLRPRVFDRWIGDRFTCEKFFFESLPGFYVTGNLYRPSETPRRRGAPGILCPHGHWPDGRLHDHDPLGSVVMRCIQLARMGATVLSLDMVGMNDSAQLPHREFGCDPHWGLSLMAVQTWNSIRALDFLLTLPEVDPKRIGVTGASGGGTQTFTLGAVDDRVAVAAPICMISYEMQGGCLCENAPLLRLDATSVDLARLFAPKPMFMGSCTGDWTHSTPRKELPAVHEIYSLYRAAGRLGHLHVDEKHNYNQTMREAVCGFFRRWLWHTRSARPVPEEGAIRPPLRDRMVWWGRSAPEAIPWKEFRELWRSRGESALRPHLTGPAAARRHLGPLLTHVLGVTLTSLSEFARKAPEGIALRSEGDRLVIAPRPFLDLSREVPFFTAYNRTPIGERVHEILAAVRKCSGKVKLVGQGKAGTWCLLATALSGQAKAVDADLRGFDPERDASWRTHLNLPSIRQIGGLATVFAMIGSRPMTLRHASPAVERLAARYAR